MVSYQNHRADMVERGRCCTNIGEVYFVDIEGDRCFVGVAGEVEYELYFAVVDVGGDEDGVDQSLLVVFVC